LNIWESKVEPTVSETMGTPNHSNQIFRAAPSVTKSVVLEEHWRLNQLPNISEKPVQQSILIFSENQCFIYKIMQIAKHANLRESKQIAVFSENRKNV
jgi:hypothetical protein